MGSRRLTFVLEVVSRRGEDLQGTREVKHVKLGLKCKEHINGLLVVNHGGSLTRSHLDGIDSWGRGSVTREVVRRR